MSPNSLPTTVSSGETPSLDYGAGGDRVSISSPFPSSFGDDIESFPLEEGISASDAKIEVVVLEDVEAMGIGIGIVCSEEDFGTTPRSRMGSMVVSPDAFFLEPHRGLGLGAWSCGVKSRWFGLCMVVESEEG